MKDAVKGLNEKSGEKNTAGISPDNRGNTVATIEKLQYYASQVTELTQDSRQGTGSAGSSDR
jgi:hypothetical protein